MSLLFLQMTIVLATSLICGPIARKLGQARVIGEIVGGIFLGPSVLGRFLPGLSGRIFPGGSLGSLDVLSTVGLILFLFLVGSELDLEHLRQQKSTAALSSFASICCRSVWPSLCPRYSTRASLPAEWEGFRLRCSWAFH